MFSSLVIRGQSDILSTSGYNRESIDRNIDDDYVMIITYHTVIAIPHSHIQSATAGAGFLFFFGEPKMSKVPVISRYRSDFLFNERRQTPLVPPPPSTSALGYTILSPILVSQRFDFDIVVTAAAGAAGIRLAPHPRDPVRSFRHLSHTDGSFTALVARRLSASDTHLTGKVNGGVTRALFSLF